MTSETTLELLPEFKKASTLELTLKGIPKVASFTAEKTVEGAVGYAKELYNRRTDIGFASVFAILGAGAFMAGAEKLDATTLEKFTAAYTGSWVGGYGAYAPRVHHLNKEDYPNGWINLKSWDMLFIDQKMWKTLAVFAAADWLIDFSTFMPATAAQTYAHADDVYTGNETLDAFLIGCRVSASATAIWYPAMCAIHKPFEKITNYVNGHIVDVANAVKLGFDGIKEGYRKNIIGDTTPRLK